MKTQTEIEELRDVLNEILDVLPEPIQENTLLPFIIEVQKKVLDDILIGGENE